MWSDEILNWLTVLKFTLYRITFPKLTYKIFGLLSISNL